MRLLSLLIILAVAAAALIAVAGPFDLLSSSSTPGGAEPAAASEVRPEPIFGVADDAALRAYPAAIGVAHGIGLRAARMYVSWASVARARPANPRDPNDPAYDWSLNDADFANYTAAGLEVEIAFWQTPSWANGGRTDSYWADNPEDLADFAYATALRYPDVRIFYDWNEPNLRRYAQPNTIEAYEPRVRAVYRALHEAQPKAIVAVASLGHYRDAGRDPVAWALRLKADGVPMDAYSVHAYPDPTKPLWQRDTAWRFDLWDVPALARILGVPVYVSEFGWSSDAADPDRQARWTAEAIRIARCSPGLERLILWGFHDHPVAPGARANPWVRFGMLDGSGRPKPVLAAARRALNEPLSCDAVARSAGAPSGWPYASLIAPAVDPGP